MGLLIQTSATESGRFALTITAVIAAKIICEGSGIKAINRPIKQAVEAQRRFRCQRLGSCSQLPKNCKDLWFFTQLGSGKKRCISFLDIITTISLVIEA